MILSLGYISTINHIKPFSEKLRLHSSKLIYQTLYLHNSIGFKYRVIIFIIFVKTNQRKNTKQANLETQNEDNHFKRHKKRRRRKKVISLHLSS